MAETKKTPKELHAETAALVQRVANLTSQLGSLERLAAGLGSQMADQEDNRNPHTEAAVSGWAKDMSVRETVESALCTDGAHHKQYYLWVLAAKLGICFDSAFITEYGPEAGIAP